MKQRRSARIILVDATGRVLLIRFAIQREGRPFTFWATPGGGIESRETPLAAARRELYEELGLTVELTGPVHEATERFEHEGALVENTDIFFTGRCDVAELTISGVTEAERNAMREARWWSPDEIAQSTETIFLPDLATAMPVR